jgi:RNA polymerase sigma factor (sigma-70 family)
MKGGLEAVFLAHRAALLRFLLARGAGDAAEDVLQELWIKASAGAAGPVANPLAYLYTTANNLMLDRRRAGQRSAARDDSWHELSRPPADASDAPSGERVLIARERLLAAEQTLASLGERTQSIFRRYRLDGASQKDIAAELGISVSAVEKHLQKAYQALVNLRRRLDAE